MPVNWKLPLSHPPLTKCFKGNSIDFLLRWMSRKNFFEKFIIVRFKFSLRPTKNWDKIWYFLFDFLLHERDEFYPAELPPKVERENLISFFHWTANMTGSLKLGAFAAESFQNITKTAFLKQKPEQIWCEVICRQGELDKW